MEFKENNHEMEKAVLKARLQMKARTLQWGVSEPYIANLMLFGAEPLEEELSSINHDMMVAQILELLSWPDMEIMEYLMVNRDETMEEVLEKIEQIQTVDDIVDYLLLDLLDFAMTEQGISYPIRPGF